MRFFDWCFRILSGLLALVCTGLLFFGFFFTVVFRPYQENDYPDFYRIPVLPTLLVFLVTALLLLWGLRRHRDEPAGSTDRMPVLPCLLMLVGGLVFMLFLLAVIRGLPTNDAYILDGITLEFQQSDYHALADGTGGLTFLMTLTAEYLRLKCNDPIEYSDIVLNPSDAPDPEEYEDSYIRFSRKAGAMEQSTRAYHVPGAEEDPHILNLITGKIPLDELKSTAKAYNCHITSFLCAVMIDAIQQIQEENAQKKHPIIISVPVNLRQFYPTKTLRNFSSYLFVGIDPKLGHYSFDEIVSQVSGQMSLLATEKRMNAKMTANVQMTNNIFFRAIPTFIKKPILSVGELLMKINEYWLQ